MTSTLTPWQQRTFQRAVDAVAAGRLAHAVLLAGERGLGKRAVAEVLAALLLCQKPVDGMACGTCRSCVLRAAGNHPDLYRVTLEERDDGRLRSEVTIDQVRALCQRLSLTAHAGGAVVALLDPADSLNVSAANALLKTLEEPAPGRYLLLLADNPSRLPATLRSRCQRLPVSAPPREEALRWLSADHDGKAAAAALDLAGGNPGQAREALQSGLPALQAAVLADLDKLTRGDARPFKLARAWIEDRPELRLAFAADAVRRLGWQRAGRSDTRLPSGFGKPADFSRFATWFDSANRARELLRTPLRPELLVGDLLRSWREAWR